MNKHFRFILLVIMLLVGIVGLYLLGIIRFNYPDRDRFPVWGIDVSHHQGDIDWELLKSEHVVFAYIKATEGEGFKDKRFLANWDGASRVGIARGAYHFFTFCKSGNVQANNFISSVPVEEGALPPVIDFEFVGNCEARPTKEALIKEVRAFVSKIEEVYGQRPIFYVTYEAYDKYLAGEIEGYKIWIRDIFSYPSLTQNTKWIFWQYSDHSRLKGVNGAVDLNVYAGSEMQFKGLLKK